MLGSDAMFRRLLLLCILLACGPIALAQHKAYKEVESSMFVTGTIDITPAGGVAAHALHQSEKLPKGIVDMVARMAPQWKFEPIALQGNAVGRSEMRLLFVARKLEDGRFSLELRSADFAAPASGAKEERLSLDRTHFKSPPYPMSLMNDGVTGDVYVVVKVGRDGRVINADVSQVNLGRIGSQQQLQRWRDAFTRSALSKVRNWTFHVPVAGPDAGKDHWFGTLPISYSFNPEPPPYGTWQTYVPGPRPLIPWLDDKHIADRDPGALSPNTFHAEGESRRLLTPLGGG